MPSSLIPGSLTHRLSEGVDRVRERVHGRLGTRPHRIFLVTRTWSGRLAGDGGYTDVAVEVQPPPMFSTGSQRDMLRPTGRDDEGDATVTDVSLRYSEDDLCPTNHTDNVEFWWRVEDIEKREGGPGVRTTWWVPSGRPLCRRGDHPDDQIDWLVTLKAVAPPVPLPEAG